MDPGWARLGRRVLTERSRHWRTRDEFAHATGLSSRLLDDLENGRRDNYLDATLAAIEVALGWAPGSCRRVVEGGRVRREMDPSLVRLLDLWPQLPLEARAMLVDIASRALGER
jgi:hypothetical protein